MERLRQWFAFEERRTDFRTEALAGLTTFISMMYILVVNPSVLSRAGIDFGGAYIATVVASIVATLIMGIVANYPIAIAPGIGINAYFVFTVIISDGVPWQEALGAAFVREPDGALTLFGSCFSPDSRRPLDRTEGRGPARRRCPGSDLTPCASTPISTSGASPVAIMAG